MRKVCVLLAVDNNSKMIKQTRQLHSGMLIWPWMLKSQHRARVSHTAKPKLLVYFHHKDFLLLLSGWEHLLQDFAWWIIPEKDPVLAKKELVTKPWTQTDWQNACFWQWQVCVHNRSTLTSKKVLAHNTQIFSGTLKTRSWLLFC